MTKSPNNVYVLHNYLADLPPTLNASQEPKIKASPYAKFDKFHHKMKKK